MKLTATPQYYAILTVLISRLCCIIPFLAIISGLTGGATLFSFIEPYRPFLILISASILGFGFYQEYKPKNLDKLRLCCKENAIKKSKRNKKILFLTTAVSLLLYSFPYYSNIFIKTKTELVIESEHLKKLELDIERMSCQGCANNIMLNLSNVQGINSSNVNFSSKKAFIIYNPQSVSKENIIKSIEAIGFQAKNQ